MDSQQTKRKASDAQKRANQRWYEKNKAMVNQQQREYYLLNKGRMNKQMRDYYEQHSEELKAKRRERYKAKKLIKSQNISKE